MSQNDKSSQDIDKESVARAQLPYKAEYCKTSRAKCKKCSQPLEANSLKVAYMTKSRFHDGYDASFCHVKCFFQIKRPTSVAEIQHYESLKYEDQKMLEDAVETRGLSILGTNVEIVDNKSNKKSKSKTTKTSGKAETQKTNGKKRKSDNGSREDDTQRDNGNVLVNYDDFKTEYAKSNRSKCHSCEEKIDKDSVRLGKLDYAAETSWNGGPVTRWHHVKCFVKNIQKLEFFGHINKVEGFADLSDEDQDMLKQEVKVFKPEEVKPIVDIKKLKSEQDQIADDEEERKLKKQSKRFFKLREEVNKVRRKDLEMLLEHMNQRSNFKDPSILIDMVTDVLLFGPLEPCPECKEPAGIVLRGGSYICTKGTESNPCSYETRDPQRGVPNFPDEFLEKFPFFAQSYKFRPRKRIFPSKLIKAVEQKEAEDNKLVVSGAPLDGLSFGVISWKGVQMNKTQVENKVVTLGGKIRTALDSKVFVILTSPDELEKKDSPKVEVAKALNVPFAKPEFLLHVKNKQDVVPLVTKCLIPGYWTGDLDARRKMLTNIDSTK